MAIASKMRRVFTRCRIWTAFPLVMLVSLVCLLNTLVIIMFLVPHHLSNQAYEMPYQSQVLAAPVFHAQGETKVVDKEIKIEKQNLSVVVNVFHGTNSNDSSAVIEDFQGHTYMNTVLKFDANRMLLAGQPPQHPVELVIGIPTVKRASKEYLTATLQQLVAKLSAKEKQRCHIVIFTADAEPLKQQQIAQHIKQTFAPELKSGLLHLVKPDPAFYPKSANIPQLWRDSPERIKWRTKQCIDYALMFVYCKRLGKYYMQLEDDVLVKPEYYSEIKQFIRARDTSKWSNLQFGPGGFIGMLFRTSILRRLAMFVKMYYWIYPVDILFRHFNDIHLYGNSQLDVYTPPLFEHLGAESSLTGQKRKINVKGKKVQVNDRVYTDANNPPAKVSTNMVIFGQYGVDGPYRKTNLWYFWGKELKLSAFLQLEFHSEMTLLRVVIESGATFAPEDQIGGGKLETSSIGKDGGCNTSSFILLSSTLTHGKIEASAANSTSGIARVKCIRLTLTKLLYINRHPRWLLLREIAIWSKP